MTARKTPILLRRSPLSDRVMALHRYTRKQVRGREVRYLRERIREACEHHNARLEEQG